MRRVAPDDTKVPTPGRAETSQVRDRRGRTWRISVMPIEEGDDADLEFWLAMTPEQRIELMSECLLNPSHWTVHKIQKLIALESCYHARLRPGHRLPSHA